MTSSLSWRASPIFAPLFLPPRGRRDTKCTSPIQITRRRSCTSLAQERVQEPDCEKTLRQIWDARTPHGLDTETRNSSKGLGPTRVGTPSRFRSNPAPPLHIFPSQYFYFRRGTVTLMSETPNFCAVPATWRTPGVCPMGDRDTASGEREYVRSGRHGSTATEVACL